MWRYFLRTLALLPLLFVCIGKVNAFEFIKSPDNPLPISYGFDYDRIQQIHVYKENNIYKGIATAKPSGRNYHSLVAIESSDGKNWHLTKEILNIPDFDLSNGRLFIDRDGNKKILFAKMDSRDLYRLYSIDCDNEANCSQNPRLFLDPNLSDHNENRGFFAPYILNSGDTYYLFYGAWGYNGFRLNLSYSSDLSNWTKCSNEIMTGGDGPFPHVEDNNLYLFVHRSNGTGIQALKTSLPLSCESSWENLGYVLSKNQPYDQSHMIFPSVVNDNGQLKLYYSGLGSDNLWHLNLTEQVQVPTPEPTSLPTPEPTQNKITPSLIPTVPILDKIPIILIPGFMASWNKDAILHNKTVGYQDWKLASYVKEYRGLIDTLKNLGYEENKDLFIFAYDWRKKVNDSVDDLNRFIETKINPDKKVDVVGHSLGGVVGRIYTQKYQDLSRVNRLITVASPHSGVVQVYKPLEAGEIDRQNTWLWLTEKIIINLNRGLFESDREVIEHMFPVTHDLFPTFNFLKDEKDEFIDKNSMHISNSLLDFYNNSVDSIFPYFTALIGEKDSSSTLAGYKVTNPNLIDNLFSNYKDGRPTDSFKSIGDYTVLKTSAEIEGDEFETLPLDHGEIIYKKEGIKKILETLQISYSEDQITEGASTILTPSLIFMIKSPAKMTVTFGDKTYEEQDGMIFIENAESGSYSLSVQGLDLGYYEIQIGQISSLNDVWETIEGKIDRTPPSIQVDEYIVNYNDESATSAFPSLTPTENPTPTVIPSMTPILTPTLSPTPIPTTSPKPTTVIILQSTQDPMLIAYQSKTNPGNNQTSDILGVESEEKIKSNKSGSTYSFLLYPFASALIVGVTWLYVKKKYEKIKP